MTPGTALERPRLDGAARLLGAGLVLLLPAAFLPDRIHESFTPAKLALLLGLGVPAYLLAQAALGRRPDPARPIRMGLALAVPVMVAVSAVRTGGWPHEAPRLLLPLLAPLVFLEVGLAFGRREHGLRRLLLLLGLSALPVLALGLTRRLAGWPPGLPDQDGPLAATIGNSNELADYAAPLAVALLAWPLLARGPWRALGVLAAPPAVLVLLSDSRAGMLALLLGLLVTALLALGRAASRKRAAAGLLAGILVAGVGVLLVAPDLVQRLGTAFHTRHPTVRARLLLWEASLELGGEHPVVGIGAGRYPAEVLPHRRAEDWALHGPDSWVYQPHNEVLWLWVEGGLAGVLLLALAAGGILVVLARSRGTALDPARPAAGGALAAFGALALVHAPLHHPAGSLAAMTVLGALAGAVGGRRRAPVARGACLLLVLAALAVGAAELRAVTHLERALGAHRRLKDAGSGTVPAPELKAELGILGAGLEGVAEAPFLDLARTVRALPLAADLDRLRRSLPVSHLEDMGLDLPPAGFAPELCRAVLERCPHHPVAEQTYARLLLRREHFARAFFRLRDAIQALPEVPRLRTFLAGELFRHNHDAVQEPIRLLKEERALFPPRREEVTRLLGLLHLRMGCEPATTGFYLRPAPEPPEAAPHLVLARRLLAKAGAETEPAVARALAEACHQEVRAALGHQPRSREALSLMADLGYGLLRETDQVLQEADWAVARSKLLYALDTLELGDTEESRRQLRLAMSKDGRLNDAFLIKARIAAQEQEPLEARAALAELHRRGLSREQLREHVKRHEGLRDLWSRGKLGPVLERP